MASDKPTSAGLSSLSISNVFSVVSSTRPLPLSLLASTGLEVLRQRVEVKQAVNYGLEKVRFLAPVRAGKRVRNHVKLAGVEDKGNGRVLLTTENTFEIEGEDKPALVALFLAMVMN